MLGSFPIARRLAGRGNNYRYTELARSHDHGASWTKADWRWPIEDNLIVPTFLNFGQDNAGARDEYVYAYFIRPQNLEITQASFGLNVHKPGSVFPRPCSQGSPL